MTTTLKIIIAIFICLTVGGLSGYLTSDGILNYYTTLNKPSWNPPNWLFGPVWSVLYLMIGVAVGIIWVKENNQTALILFGIQLVFNFFWSIIFFKFQSPGFALIEITLMLFFIILTIIAFKKIDLKAAYLMIPYACWVSFATFLNFTIWRLN